MKRTILLALLFALVLAACGSPASTTATTSTTAATGSNTSGGATAAPASSLPAYGEEVTAPGGSYRLLDPEDFAKLLDKAAPVLINVQTPHESEIAGTDYDFDYLTVPQNLGKLPDRDAAIAVYDGNGDLSVKVVQKLVSFGYTGVYMLDGGMEAWQEAGYELE